MKKTNFIKTFESAVKNTKTVNGKKTIIFTKKEKLKDYQKKYYKKAYA